MLYRCLIRGENFPGELLGEYGLMGFYTTRWVEAASEEEAEMLALEALRSDPDLQPSLEVRDRSKAAKVFFEEIDEVPPETERCPNKGATWFRMDE